MGYHVQALRLQALPIGISVQSVASSNIKKGLELQGGTRVVLRPEIEITNQERNEVIQVMENRLNKYGLSDIAIRKADIGGTKSIVPSEGIVFKYKGKTYKFTGAFAPVNQITGLIYF